MRGHNLYWRKQTHSLLKRQSVNCLLDVAKKEYAPTLSKRQVKKSHMGWFAAIFVATSPGNFVGDIVATSTALVTSSATWIRLWPYQVRHGPFRPVSGLFLASKTSFPCRFQIYQGYFHLAQISAKLYTPIWFENSSTFVIHCSCLSHTSSTSKHIPKTLHKIFQASNEECRRLRPQICRRRRS